MGINIAAQALNILLDFILIAGLGQGVWAAALFIKGEDTELFNVSVTAIKLFSFSYLIGWADMCFSSLFTALDRPVRSLLVSFLGTLVFPFACLLLLTPVRQLNGVWLTPAVSGAAPSRTQDSRMGRSRPAYFRRLEYRLSKARRRLRG